MLHRATLAILHLHPQISLYLGDKFGESLGGSQAPPSFWEVPGLLGCRKWGFKRWGFKEIRGDLRKKAFFLRFLDFPGALQALQKQAKKAEKGRERPVSADFREGRPDTP